MASPLVILLLIAAAVTAVFYGINSLTFAGQEPVLKLPTDPNTPKEGFNAGKWLSEAPKEDIIDFVVGGLMNTVEWFARGLAGFAESAINWLISVINPLFKAALPFIKIPSIFVKAIFLILLGLFLINQLKGLADKAYSGVTLFTAILLAAIAALTILIVFASVFIK